ncbi:unnamed protein product [Schistosoma mattheei]|uniref:Uncharacterized protein n=1 Tax=Schistosoma mattheei TaxID=31246 RepID=A0A183P7T3_9TREM|nr:unnamed protein product [Schistosoma mattheei]
MWNLVNKAALQNAAHERAEAEELRLQSWQKIQQTNIQLLNYNKDYIRKPLEIAEECLANREQRHGIDEVKDIVERALSKVSAFPC